ncbi:MAG: TMEM164 family acyltransferase, partial [bacterium]
MAAVGFPHFGAAHLFWLAGLGTAAMTAAFFHERTDEKSRLRMRKGLGLLCFLFHLLTQGIFLVRGTYGLYDLPLHLCALTAYLVLLHAAAGEKSMVSATVGEILFFPCLP